ncbi:MAG: DUF2267 domain-containing protein [Spirochaetia bacterium]
MQFDEILGLVQNRARLASSEEALTATRATLSTLNERLAGGETKDIASQLPRELAKFMDETGKGERFDVDEFFKRVSRKEGVDLPVSVHHARSVISVLKEALTEGEFNDILAQLPNDYKELFQSGYEGDLNI